LWPYLKFGGVYIVEDLHCGQYWPGFQNTSGINFLDFAKKLANDLSLWHSQPKLFHNRYNVDPRDRPDIGLKFDNNMATSEIFAISYYDSIVAIEKRKITEPYHQIK